MAKSFDVHNLEAGKEPASSSLQDRSRAAVLQKTGIDRSEDIRKQLNLPKLLLNFLTQQFGSNDFCINKDEVTAEDICSETYRATCVLNKQSVLLKCLPNSIMCEENKAKIQRWRSKRLIGIQKCIVSFQEGQKEIFVLEVEAESLDRVIKRLKSNETQIDESQIWCILQRITKILKALQEKELRYKDLKMDKIYINTDGAVFLSNPLRYFVDNSIDRDPFAVSDTGSSAIYTPPEVISGEESCIKSDVWILGAIFYELAMQKPAYAIADPANIFASLNKVVEGNKPENLSSAFSADLQSIIWSCLSVDTAQRPTLEILISKATEATRSMDLKNLLQN